jgi:DNA topoisomerase-1
MKYTPDDLKDEGIEEDYLSLYELIFNHTLASLMQPAKYISNIYNFSNNGRLFQMIENIIVSPGFFVFLDYYKKFSISKDSSLINEEINHIKANKININEYLGRIPRRYTEGILIKTLEKLGIGRPSTYNAFSGILIKRKYSTISRRGEFIPTPLGFDVNN